MKWIRSYYKDPETMLASGCSFVWDGNGHHNEIYWADNFDYYNLFLNADDDFTIIEWDLALDREDRKLFESYIAAEPDRVQVAPYKHYRFKNEGQEWSYLHRRDLDNFSQPGDKSCMLFGFGMTYIPLAIAEAFMVDIHQRPFYECRIPYELMTQPGVYRHVTTEIGLPAAKVCHQNPENVVYTAETPAWTPVVNDMTFASWHWTEIHRPVPIRWDVRPVHLGYQC